MSAVTGWWRAAASSKMSAVTSGWRAAASSSFHDYVTLDGLYKYFQNLDDHGAYTDWDINVTVDPVRSTLSANLRRTGARRIRISRHALLGELGFGRVRPNRLATTPRLSVGRVHFGALACRWVPGASSARPRAQGARISLVLPLRRRRLRDYGRSQFLPVSAALGLSLSPPARYTL